METLTQEVMRHRISRIGSHRRAHRRPVTPPTETLQVVEIKPCEPEVRVQIVLERVLPHAAWIVGGWLLSAVAGVMLGVGIAQHWG
jgi:hypothetical protein